LEAVAQKTDILLKLGEIYRGAVASSTGGAGVKAERDAILNPNNTSGIQLGLSLVLATMFRGSSGVLPPYVVEFFPSLLRNVCR